MARKKVLHISAKTEAESERKLNATLESMDEEEYREHFEHLTPTKAKKPTVKKP